MAKYDEEIIDNLCSKIDLHKYASKQYDFKLKSNTYFCHCPLHLDKTPSLAIPENENYFHCFSCGVGGSVLSWMMKIEKLSFNESIKKLSDITGIDVTKLKVSETLMMFKEMKKHLETQPKDIQRNILKESILEQYSKEYPNEWLNEGIVPKVMDKYGIRVDEKGNRIVYPVYDNEYNLIGIKGRTRYSNYEKMGIQKYMNYYKIGTVDYFLGMKENRDNIIKNNKVIVFEGIKSGMKVENWGFDYWLASETSWLNESQIIILIKLGVKDIYIAYDNDVDIKKIKKCTKKLRNYANLWVIYDSKGLLGKKDEKLSPCDKGEKIWRELLVNAIRI